jgi:hypothetical protein
MFSRTRIGFGVVAATALASGVAVMALPAGATAGRTVKCRGTADFCGASVSLAGGFRDRKVTIALTDTDFGTRPTAVSVLPDAASVSYTISKPAFEEGGSQYVFTLRSAEGNPSNARIVLLFSAGVKQPVPH